MIAWPANSVPTPLRAPPRPGVGLSIAATAKPQSSCACFNAYPARTGSDFRRTRNAIASVAAAARLDVGLLLAWAVTSSVVPAMPSVQRSNWEKLGRKPSWKVTFNSQSSPQLASSVRRASKAGSSLRCCMRSARLYMA